MIESSDEEMFNKMDVVANEEKEEEEEEKDVGNDKKKNKRKNEDSDRYVLPLLLG